MRSRESNPMLRSMEYRLLGPSRRQALSQQCLRRLTAAAPAAEPTTAAVRPGAGSLQQGITPQWGVQTPLSDPGLHHSSDERTQHPRGPAAPPRQSPPSRPQPQAPLPVELVKSSPVTARAPEYLPAVPPPSAAQPLGGNASTPNGHAGPAAVVAQGSAPTQSVVAPVQQLHPVLQAQQAQQQQVQPQQVQPQLQKQMIPPPAAQLQSGEQVSPTHQPEQQAQRPQPPSRHSRLSKHSSPQECSGPCLPLPVAVYGSTSARCQSGTPQQAPILAVLSHMGFLQCPP